MAVDDIVGPGTVLSGAWWLQAAQAAVRRECGWHVAPSVREELRVDAHGGRVLVLPTKRITDLERVVAGGVDVTDRVAWSRAGTLQLRAGCWPDEPGSVLVELVHGWPAEEVPDVAALIVTLGRRARTQSGVVASQSVNGASVSYAMAGGAPLSVPLLEIERQLLAPYRLNWGLR